MPWGLQRALGLGSYRTAWTCLHKLRRVMVRPGRERLSGDVEVDEVFIGGVEKGGGKRHVGTKALVAIAAEVKGPRIGRVRMQQIPDASSQSLAAFVQEAVAPGALIITDGWTAYPGLERLGYVHRPRVVRSSGQTASTLLPRVHRVAALLKRWRLAFTKGGSPWSTSAVTWMNSRSASTGDCRDTGESCSTASSNRQWRLNQCPISVWLRERFMVEPE